jgi:hypothetical protein
MIGFWLNSSQAEEADGKPFNVDNDPSMIKRYAEYWGWFICYCLRMLNEEEGSGIQFLRDQRDDLEELQRLAEEDEDEYGIDRQVLWVSMRFIMHSDYATRKSGLVHFLGVLGYDEWNKRWRELSTFTPILAGLQFCMCVFTLEHTLPLRERDEFTCMDGGIHWKYSGSSETSGWWIEWQVHSIHYTSCCNMG